MIQANYKLFYKGMCELIRKHVKAHIEYCVYGSKVLEFKRETIALQFTRTTTFQQMKEEMKLFLKDVFSMSNCLSKCGLN